MDLEKETALRSPIGSDDRFSQKWEEKKLGLCMLLPWDKAPELTRPWRFPGGEEAVWGVHGCWRDTRDAAWEGQGPGGRA